MTGPPFANEQLLCPFPAYGHARTEVNRASLRNTGLAAESTGANLGP
jgi:hypothetical protein